MDKVERMPTKKGLQSFVLYGRLGGPIPPELATGESTERRVVDQWEEWGKLEVLTSHPPGRAPTEKQKEHHLVPDVRCPGCGSEIKLDNRTYAFYDGPIRCQSCQAVFRIRTGDVDLVFQTSVPEFVDLPPMPGATGGMLIAPPELLEPGLAVPPPLLATLSAECIPGEPLCHMRTVARHYRNGSWPAVAVFSRAAVQATLKQCGIADGPFVGMLAKARERGLVEGFVLSCCETVREAGGESSHSLEGPTSQREAIAVIAAAATVLGRLYAVPPPGGKTK